MTTEVQDLPQIKGVKNIPLEEQFSSGHRTCQGCESALVMRLMIKAAGDYPQALDAAVKRQLMTDVPYGVLLSGGLDSSITAALAMKYSKQRVEADDQQEAWWPHLHSFAIGLEGSPDLAAAKEVAAHIGTEHHTLTFTVDEGVDAIPEVIRHLETYDVTTIRAATPMFLMARRIKAMGIKMVLSGEGADEIFGGYLYFHHKRLSGFRKPYGNRQHEKCWRGVMVGDAGSPFQRYTYY